MAVRSIEQEEAEFQRWYSKKAKNLGLSPEPYDPKHHYDYKAAWRHGAKPNKEKHWPSRFKKSTHPRLIINDINTKTGERIRNRARRKGLGSK